MWLESHSGAVSASITSAGDARRRDKQEGRNRNDKQARREAGCRIFMAAVTPKERGVCANDKGGFEMSNFLARANRQEEIGPSVNPRAIGWREPASNSRAAPAIGAVLGALSGLLISISDAVARPPTAQQLLDNPNNCWILEHYEYHGGYGGGGWEEWTTRDSSPRTLASGAGLSDVFSKGRVDTNHRGETYILDPSLDTSRLRRVPCPPSSSAYIGVETAKALLFLTSEERDRISGLLTNRFSDRHDPLGVGVILGYNFQPWSNGVVVSPFVSFDYLNMSVNHTFAGGSFLGTRSNFAGTAGVKIGPQIGNGVWLYGIAGVSVLNETLKVNFIPVASSTDATVAGGTVGAGFAFQPSFLQKFSHPVSLFAEYQHTWWDEAHFNAPAASPFFNYTFRREDDVVKLGFTVSLSAPQPAATPSYPVKTPVK